jgi:hypothetical protein
MMKTLARASVAAIAISMGCSAASAAVIVDFEGGTDRAAINGFYDGGTDSAGASGADLGISFSGAGFDTSTAPNLGISSSIAYMQSTPLLFSASTAFNTIGFDQYFFRSNNVLTLYSGANGTGDVVFSGTFGPNCDSVCTFTRQDFVLPGFALSGPFEPNADFTGIDNLTLGAIPEPGTWAMMLMGFGAVGYSMRRRKLTYRRAQAV